MLVAVQVQQQPIGSVQSLPDWLLLCYLVTVCQYKIIAPVQLWLNTYDGSAWLQG